MENDLRGIENYFEFTGGSSYRESTVPWPWLSTVHGISSYSTLKLH